MIPPLELTSRTPPLWGWETSTGEVIDCGVLLGQVFTGCLAGPHAAFARVAVRGAT